MKYMLDTNICIYIIKNKPQSVIDRLKQCSVEDICLSSVTLAGLEYGVEKSAYPNKNRHALTMFLSPFQVLSFDCSCALEYGKIRADLERKGTPIGALDMMIAAQALSVGLILVTNNMKEFQRVGGLKSENWAEPSIC